MLKYLVIQLADDAVSYCHYKNNSESEQFMPIETLKAAVRFGMVENLNIQFVFPNRALPDGYREVIDMIDNIKIMPCSAPASEAADILICNSITEIEDCKLLKKQIVIFRCKDINDAIRSYDIVKDKCARLSILITDMDNFSEDRGDEYKSVLTRLGKKWRADFIQGRVLFLNILTDRLFLGTMNNCNAGDTVITIMPNGKFYPCAGFYYDDADEDFGDIDRGVQIKNSQLFKLSYAPICRHCDAFHCRRCVWLNRKRTLEVNTPSHEQCVVAHIEHNASCELLYDIRKYGDFFPAAQINKSRHLDPFDARDEWM